MVSIQQIQRFFKDNGHGLLFGLVASIVVFYFRQVSDPSIIFWVLLISSISGAIITQRLHVPRKFLSTNSIMIILGLIAVISFIGIQTETFSTVDKIIGGLINLKVAKAVGLGSFGILLSMISVGLAAVAVIVGLFILGIPLGGLINAITDNFILVAIILGVVLLFSLLYKK